MNVWQGWTEKDLQRELTKYIERRDAAMTFVGEIKAELMRRSIHLSN